MRHRYGGPEVLALAEVAEPEPGPADVLIRVHAIAVSAGDVLLLRGEPTAIRAVSGLRRPKQPMLGRDVAGVVQAVGADVTGFRVGDPVYAEADQGGWAELVAVPERFVARRPANVDAVHAAAVPVSAGSPCNSRRPSAPR